MKEFQWFDLNTIIHETQKYSINAYYFKLFNNELYEAVKKPLRP